MTLKDFVVEMTILNSATYKYMKLGVNLQKVRLKGSDEVPLAYDIGKVGQWTS